jgi:hypothetical protein
MKRRKRDRAENKPVRSNKMRRSVAERVLHIKDDKWDHFVACISGGTGQTTYVIPRRDSYQVYCVSWVVADGGVLLSRQGLLLLLLLLGKILEKCLAWVTLSRWLC